MQTEQPGAGSGRVDSPAWRSASSLSRCASWSAAKNLDCTRHRSVRSRRLRVARSAHALAFLAPTADCAEDEPVGTSGSAGCL